MNKQLRGKTAGNTSENDLWQQYMQRRVMQLLFRYDQKLFQGQFRTFYTGSSLPTLPILQFYDRYLKLQMFSAELLDDILPRVRRQWSLQTNHLALTEEAPVHGEIDWQRTLTRTMEETPNHPPLRFDTRLRQQSMDIPENVLVVAILLRYRQMIQETLQGDQRAEMLSSQERQHLVGLDERLERELATPYTRVLIRDARHKDIETLVTQVSGQLRSGSNPYRDLISWWEQIDDLYIGHTDESTVQRHLTLLPGRRDARMGQWLYELWLALEFLTLLDATPEAQLDNIAIDCDQLHWTFTWQERRFHFSFQRQFSPIMDDTEQSGWKDVPAFRSHFAISREQPLKIEHKGTVIWQEPPFVMAAMYFSQEQKMAHLGGTIQQILGMMQFQRSQQGALLAPYIGARGTKQFTARALKPAEDIFVNTVSANTSLLLYKFTPDLALEELQKRLRVCIQRTVSSLPERATPNCHGFMLDTDSINASGDHISDYNVVCPKPHIGQGIFDLVSRDRHCLTDPRLCHVIDQEIFPPQVNRILNLKDFKEGIEQIRNFGVAALKKAEMVGDEDYVERCQNLIFERIGQTIEQYVHMRGSSEQQEKYLRDAFFREYWDQHAYKLDLETRDMLISGEYVWDEYQKTPLDDWAAPAVQYCRALERETKRRFYTPVCTEYKTFNEWTLGKVKSMYNSGKLNKDWPAFARRAKAFHIEEKILIDQFVRPMVVEFAISDLRNRLAHGQRIDRETAFKLRNAILGLDGQTSLLYWTAKNIGP